MKVTARREIIENGIKLICKVEIRYDDECKNGHNSFFITGSVYEGRVSERACIVAGSCHEEIVEFFPELKKFIKWHGMTENEPLYYLANTLFHAKTRENMSLPLNAPTHFEKRLKFEGIPFTFAEQKSGFWEYLESIGDFNNIEIESIKYDGKDSYNYGDNFSFTGFIKENEPKKWYRAPFNSKREADEFINALRNHTYSIIKIPTRWNKAVIPDLNAARNCAVWLDATDEELLSEDLRQKLIDRLPALMEEFRNDLNELWGMEL